jgi:hypothetical protein
MHIGSSHYLRVFVSLSFFSSFAEALMRLLTINSLFYFFSLRRSRKKNEDVDVDDTKRRSTVLKKKVMAKKKMQNIRRCATFGENATIDFGFFFVHSNDSIPASISHETVLSKFLSIIFARCFLYFGETFFCSLLQFKFSFISI